MLGIPRRYAHFVFGVIQSGLTSSIASGIASASFIQDGSFFSHWIQSWLVSWILMLPIVIFAAPGIRILAHFLTSESE